MRHLSELQNTLSHFFDWHKSRLDCLGQIIQALFIVRTINLTQIASAFQTDIKEESSYRRVCRFFTDFLIDLGSIVILVLKLFPLNDKCVLILDRTNWKWGKTPINILMLSIAYRGIGIPLFWAMLDLEGNSCTEDRTRLLRRVIERLGVDKVDVLLGDREFVGNDWFNFLIEQDIPFAIRAKQNFVAKVDGGARLPLGHLRKKLGQKRVYNYPIKLWGFNLYVSVDRKQGAKEQPILVSNI